MGAVRLIVSHIAKAIKQMDVVLVLEHLVLLVWLPLIARVQLTSGYLEDCSQAQLAAGSKPSTQELPSGSCV